MRHNSSPRPLRRFFLYLILSRVVLPLMAVGLAATVGVGYLGRQNLLNQQSQVTQNVAQFIGQHIVHGGSILNSVARLAEKVGADKLNVFMENTWEAYGYFDTLYFLDKDNRINLIVPPDPDYSGLDMSNLPDFQRNREQRDFHISRPFISIRTGEPTVSLVRTLSNGGTIVGELNLGMFQHGIERISENSINDFVFITDQSGTLLAHPDADRVRQQTNLSNLGIFASLQAGKNSAFYPDGDQNMIGTASREQRTGWVVIDQIPLTTFLASFAWIFLMIFAASLIIWMALAWSLRKHIQRYVIAPLEQLSHSANALALGDFTHVEALPAIPAAFAELHKLAADFQTMSTTLQIRETDLQNARDELEARVEERTEELTIANRTLTATGENLQHSNQELQKEIAERKRVEAQLAQKIVEIETAHEALKNAQSQILQQEKMASIGQLAAGVAHEINNPIGFVNSNLGTLKDYVTNMLTLIDAYSSPQPGEADAVENRHERIDRIKQEIDFDFLRDDIGKLIVESIDGAIRVKRIVQDLRDFSRPGCAEWLLANLHEGLDSTLNILANELKYKADVIREYGPLPPVECIPSQINQVFMNILINAGHAINDRGQITIRSGSTAEEAWISIADTGKGIDPAHLDRIFDPFFTTKPVGMGTGLGLSVSHGIIKNHGGKIEVQSRIGQGTTFTVRLPLRQRHTAAENAEPA